MSGPQTLEKAAAAMCQAFGLATPQVCLDTDPEMALFAAMQTGSWVRASRLRPDGRFRFKLEIEAGTEVAFTRLDTMAARLGMLVAHAVAKDDPADFRYILAGPAGRRLGSLAFRMEDDEVVCDEVTAPP